MPMRPQIMSSRSIKNGMAAFLLGVLTPGLGQIFNGQLWKGVLSYGGLLGFFLVSTAIGNRYACAGRDWVRRITEGLSGHFMRRRPFSRLMSPVSAPRAA
jgi:TM2 domain-containing membrane protein YozV